MLKKIILRDWFTIFLAVAVLLNIYAADYRTDVLQERIGQVKDAVSILYQNRPHDEEWLLDLAARAEKSLVTVEVYLKYDEGVAPNIYNSEKLIDEERPYIKPGWLVAEEQVVSEDIFIHPRFIEAIRLTAGGESRQARISSHVVSGWSCFLSFDDPFTGVEPLVFGAAGKGEDRETEGEEKFWVVTTERQNDLWQLTAQPLATKVVYSTAGRTFASRPRPGVVFDNDGQPVTLMMRPESSLDPDIWQQHPAGWAQIGIKKINEKIPHLEEKSAQSIVRVSLRFRSPSGKSGGRGRFNIMRSDEEEIGERNVLGVRIDKKRVLVLAALEPKVTARLEGITAFFPKVGEVELEFEATLSDYGALLARLPEGSATDGESLGFSEKEIRQLGMDDQLLYGAEISVQGTQRTAYFQPLRIRNFNAGWRGQIYPKVFFGMGDYDKTFLFDRDGRLLALPLIRRQKVEAYRNWNSNDPNLTPVTYLKDVFENISLHVDSSNIPLEETEEKRLAWMGLELQPLNRNLARANRVSDRTRDGEIGALVSYVYPGSPAAEAGVEAGWIFLRLHVEDMARPVEVMLRDSNGYGPEFSWEYLDQVDPRMLEKLPTPWPSAENSFSRTLTNLGFDTPFEAEFIYDGETMRLPFVVTLRPPYYETAPRATAPELGLTVRNITYEVRRYLQLDAEDPGVVVSRVESGGKAAVAGIRPYEIITHINGNSVTGAEEFDKISATTGELRLSVRRMTTGRVVKLQRGN